MWWRLTKTQFERGRGAANRAALRALVTHGPAPGVLAFVDRTAVGWCAVAPRADLPRLDMSRVLARVDDAPVWSIGCLFVAREYRRGGVSARLVLEATRYAGRMGAVTVEAYPIDTARENYPAAFAWTGFASTFRAAGFAEVARRSPHRPIMRRSTRSGTRAPG
ncbi:MAG: GNAT family N-acetyltransferase [Steroidobacteraceae bacterium]